MGAGGFLSHDLCFTGKDKTFDSAKSEIMIPPGRGMMRDRRDNHRVWQRRHKNILDSRVWKKQLGTA